MKILLGFLRRFLSFKNNIFNANNGINENLPRDS